MALHFLSALLAILFCFPLSAIAESSVESAIDPSLLRALRGPVEFAGDSSTGRQVSTESDPMVPLQLPGKEQPTTLKVYGGEIQRVSVLSHGATHVRQDVLVAKYQLGAGDTATSAIGELFVGGSALAGYLRTAAGDSYTLEITGEERGAPSIRVASAVFPEGRLLERQLRISSRSSQLQLSDSPKSTDETMHRTSEIREIQLAAVAPSEFVSGRSSEQVVTQLLGTVSAASRYYTPLKLRLNLVGVQIYTEPSVDPFYSASLRGDADAMLDTVEREWLGVTSPEHDIVAVFGRKDYDGTLGIAYLSSSCIEPEFSLLFATQGVDSLAGELSLAGTLAHEIGHVIGMYHDEKLYSSGPSLMWPYFVQNPSGFSQVSINEYLAFAGPGRPGGGCFSEVAVAETDKLSFVGGERQLVRVGEGSLLSRELRVIGDNGDVQYQISGLPAGAVFDPSTATLTYRPGYSVVPRGGEPRKKVIRIAASRTNASGEREEGRAVLRVTVLDRNQPPHFTNSVAEAVSVAPGETVRFVVRATDRDAEKVSLRLVSRAALRGLPGKKRLDMSESRARFSWKVPADFFLDGGPVVLRFQAKDSRGGVAFKDVTLQPD